MRLSRRVFCVIRQAVLQDLSMGPKTSAVFNEVNIQMIDRNIQESLFGKRIPSYTLSQLACDALKKHGINAREKRAEVESMHIDFPKMGDDVKHHFEKIALELSEPYLNLINCLPSSTPTLPTQWDFKSGWTRYADGEMRAVESPSEDCFVFDTEVLVEESNAPIIATAVTDKAWYLWVSSRLFNELDTLDNNVHIQDLIPFYSVDESLKKPKCVIGHFVSYDRARIAEEYLTEVRRSSAILRSHLGNWNEVH